MSQHLLPFAAAPASQPSGLLRADGTLIDALELPDLVWTVSLWRPYAGLVMAGLKSLETRTWPWPYGVTWLGIWAALHIDSEAMKRLGKVAEDHVGPEQVLLGIVEVVGCRPLVPADAPRSLFYGPGRYAWELTRPLVFRRPVTVAEAGLRKLPQKFARVDRRVIVEALAA
jgi:hypothetical protein